jgi:predicted dehydrogenase
MSRTFTLIVAAALAAVVFGRGALAQEAPPAQETPPAADSPAADAEGFVSLFDGKTLAGWVGAVHGYEVQDGFIVCVPEKGGNLYTEKEYSDFVLRFDFKLTPGANNGLGLRAPLEGDAAYVGMELQILDDTADVYKDLQPYQYHGSIYGVVACERGHQSPVGKWNSQEVTCNGRHVKVVLNGVTIVDADIDQASSPQTIDGADHPGLKRTAGHIGFLGHGSRVKFRNIRIKELTPEAKVGIIGLDSYHAVAFTQLFHDPSAAGDLAGVRVVGAVPAGSPDIAESAENLPKWTAAMADYGVPIVASIEELLPQCDAVLVTSLDGRAHLAQAQAAIAAGKPLFIDRPLAASLADAVEIYRLAEAAGVPIFSCSQHRFSPGFIGMRNHEEVGDVLGCEVYGGCPREPHHPDLFWHAVHGIETLYTIMGPGCTSVTRASTDAAELVTGVWADGRIGTYRGLRQGAVAYSALVYGSKGIAPAGQYGYAAPVKGVVPPGRYMGYEALAVEIARFVKTRQPPVPAAETLEIFAFLEAAEQSKREGGLPVRLDGLLNQVRAAAR